MAATLLRRPTIADRFIADFNQSVFGDEQARNAIFAQEKTGYPMFYTCEDPDVIGFIYTDKRGNVSTSHLRLKSVFTNERVTFAMLRAYYGETGTTATTLPQLIFNHYSRHGVQLAPHFRQSSDADAISFTFYNNDGSRNDFRIALYNVPIESPAARPLTTADFDHRYGSCYYRYYIPTMPTMEPRE